MRAYYDTSALIGLYVVEDFTDAITAYVTKRAERINIHELHGLEAENGVRAKVFRGEMTETQCRQVLTRLKRDTANGCLVRRSVNWEDVFSHARRVSADITVRSGCRSLDILHIAVALHWRCSVFVSADDRQLKAAVLAHLRTRDARSMPADGGNP